MNKIGILDKPYAESYYVEDYKVVVILWKGGKITGTEYRNTFLSILDFVKRGHKMVNYFSDTRDQGTISTEDRKWFQEFVMVEAQKLGLKRGAVIASSNVFKRYYMNMILAVSGMYKIEIKLFDDKDKAQKWLVSFGDYK